MSQKKDVGKIILVFLCIVILSSASLVCSCVAPKSSQAPTIKSFTASPENINAGQSATLSWDVSGAKFVSMIPGAESLPAWGNAVASPTTTTTYTLLATNEYLGIFKTVTITVATPATSTTPAPSTTSPVTTTTPSFTTPNLSINPGLFSNIIHALHVPLKTVPIILDPNFMGKLKYTPTTPTEPSITIPSLKSDTSTPPIVANIPRPPDEGSSDNVTLYSGGDNFIAWSPYFLEYWSQIDKSGFLNWIFVTSGERECEDLLFAKVNAYRVSNGRAALQRNSVIDGLCRKATREWWAAWHTYPNSTIKQHGHDTWPQRQPALLGIQGINNCGENVNFGCNPHPNYDADMSWLLQGWIDSPPHNETMLMTNWTISGMGIYIDKSTGCYYVCQDFAGPY